MASLIPKEYKKEITDALVAETMKVALFTNAYNTASSLYSTTNEVVGVGYTAGGASLASKTQSYVDTTNSMLDAADTPWTAASFTARYAVVYSVTPATLNKIRFIYDLGVDKTVTTGTFTLQWNASGLVKIS